MPSDGLAAAIPQTPTTKAATFRGQGIPFPGGTSRKGQTYRVIYTSATSSTTNALQFSVDLSYDGGSTWQQEVLSKVISLTSSAVSGEIFLLFRIDTAALNNGGVPIQAALTCNLSGAGTPSVAYRGDDVASGPT